MANYRRSETPTKRSEAKGQQVCARIKKKDEALFLSIAKKEFNNNEAEATRELISEALTRRRLLSVGKDQTLNPVKEAQLEVVSAETEELKTLLKDALVISKSSGTSIDRVVSQNREIYGVIFHILRSVLNVKEHTSTYLARPFLEEEGKKEDEIMELFIEEESQFAGAAQTLLESVRAKINQP